MVFSGAISHRPYLILQSLTQVRTGAIIRLYQEHTGLVAAAAEARLGEIKTDSLYL